MQSIPWLEEGQMIEMFLSTNHSVETNSMGSKLSLGVERVAIVGTFDNTRKSPLWGYPEAGPPLLRVSTVLGAVLKKFY